MREMLMEKIIFSKHAKHRMIERKVAMNSVIDAIKSPKQLLYDKWKDLYISISSDGSAIVYAFHGSYIEIVTVLSKREFNAIVSKYGYSRYKVIV